jgi:pimeloyl-ACP methyl ester carboxylesterase
MRRVSPVRFVAMLTAAYRERARAWYRIQGTRRASLRYAAMEGEAPSIRGARVVSIPGGGHFILRDAPDVFVREVSSDE